MGLVSNNQYSVGRGSSSGQVSILDTNGKVFTYADSLSDAEDMVEALNNQETITQQEPVSHISSYNLFKGYLFEKRHGYQGDFEDYKSSVKPPVTSSTAHDGRFVVIYKEPDGALGWRVFNVDTVSEARKLGREYGTVQLAFPYSDFQLISKDLDPVSGKVDADVFNFIKYVTSSIQLPGLVIRIHSGFNKENINKAVSKVRTFLDRVGAWYKHHRSKASDSEYFLVERPGDRMSPEVDVRVSDHDLPERYQQPDLDIDPEVPARVGAYSVQDATDLLQAFFDGEVRNIVEGEPIEASFRRFIGSASSKPIVAYHGTQHHIKKFSCSVNQKHEGGGLGLTQYGVSFAKKVGLAYKYADGGRIYKVSLNAPLDRFINGRSDFKRQSQYIKQVCTNASLVKAINDFDMGVTASIAKRFVKLGVVGFYDGVSYNIWDDGIIQIIAVAELGGQGGSDYEGSDIGLKVDHQVAEIWVDKYIYDEKLSVEEAIEKIKTSGRGFSARALKIFKAKCAKSTAPPSINFKPVSSSYTPLFSDGGGGISITSGKVQATRELFESIQVKDPVLWKRLNTRVETDPQLYEQYKNVIFKGSLAEEVYRLLQEQKGNPFLNVYFSVSGLDVIGVFFFNLFPNKELICNIKLCSFKEKIKQNTVLIRDVITFIEESVPSYSVEWEVIDGNEHLSNHIDFIRSYGIEPKKVTSFGSYYSFFIPKGSVRGGVGRTPKVERKVPLSGDKNEAGIQKKAFVSDRDTLFPDGTGDAFQGSSIKRSKGNATLLTYNQPVYSAKETLSLIESATAQELLDGNDNPEFMSREKHLRATKAVGDSQIMRCYANTIELRTKSEKFKQNQTYYRQWVLLKDFMVIARDKKIPIEQAIDYSLNFGDVNIRCSCPSQLYHGMSYMGTELGYLYGLPREKRFPKVRNPDLQNTTCKHVHIALEHILKNKEKIIQMFATYYKRLDETPPDTMIAIPASAVEEDEFGDEARETAELLGEELPPPYSTEPEIISDQDPNTDTVVIDTKMAEGLLPQEQQVKYAGDEDKPKDEALLDEVADSVSEEEVQELEDEIEQAGTGPRSDDERFTTEWSFQRLKMVDDEEDNSYPVLLSASDRATLITSTTTKIDDKTLQVVATEIGVFVSRVGFLLLEAYPDCELTADDAFVDVPPNKQREFEFKNVQNGVSVSLLSMKFTVKADIFDRAFLVCYNWNGDEYMGVLSGRFAEELDDTLAVNLARMVIRRHEWPR